MSFKDKKFCPFYKDCYYGRTCGLGLNELVLAAAGIWWREEGGEGENVPIETYSEPPECFKNKLNKKDES